MLSNELYINTKMITYQRVNDVIIQPLNDTINEFSSYSSIADYYKNLNLPGQNNLIILAFGKASGHMANALINSLDKNINVKGVVASSVIPEKLDGLEYIKSGHPFPNKKSLEAGRKVLHMAQGAKEEDLVLCLVSGGGSALIECLEPGTSLEDMRLLTENLLALGLEDHEINVFRKLLSKLKGGKLAKAIYPASVVNLIISDDVRGDLEAIASGPTIESTLNVEQIDVLINSYSLSEKLPNHIFQLINQSKYDVVSKKDRPYPLIRTEIILDNKIFQNRFSKKVKLLNYFDKVIVLENSLGSRKKSDIPGFFNQLDSVFEKYSEKNVCVIAGGEIPIKVRNKGLGGRNQHFSILGYIKIKKIYDWDLVCVGSDGQDYIKGIAGGIATSAVFKKNNKLIEEAQKATQNTNSYSFHEMHNSHVYCDDGTGMNVSDIYIFAYHGKGI